MKKTRVNYCVDVVIALAFVMSAVSGLVFLLPVGNSTFFGVSYAVWDQVHVLSSLLMIVGVLVHLVLHWTWIVAMTKKQLLALVSPPHVAETDATFVERRGFLRTMGVAVVALGVTVIGGKLLFKTASTEETQPLKADDAVAPSTSTSTPAFSADVATPTLTPNAATATPVPAATPSESVPTVACHKGVTYDPYPGRCRLYVDHNGDGYCDYSIPSGA